MVEKIRYWLDTNEWGAYDAPNIKEYKYRALAEKQARKLAMYSTVSVEKSAGIFFIKWSRKDEKTTH